MGNGGGLTLLLGHEQVAVAESSTDARFSVGHDTGTDGKSRGIAPRAIKASRHKNAFPTLFETYMSCLVERRDPDTSLVDTSTIKPPKTPMSSEIAPRIDRVTGKISFLDTPMARAVLSGIIEL